MSEDEMAALAIALEVVIKPPATESPLPPRSRWKLAARMPELDMEDLRALH